MVSWALRFTPLVGADYERGIVLDITGTKRIHAGEETLLSKISEALETRGIKASLCIAPTIGCAWALAQCSGEKCCLVRMRELKNRLLPLPLKALRLSEDTRLALGQIGIQSVSDLIKLPRKGVSQRFGAEPLLRLDQALGIRAETLEYLHSAEPLVESLAFEIPLTSHASVKHAVLKILKKLLDKLEVKLLKASLFRIECFEAGQVGEGVRGDWERGRPRPLVATSPMRSGGLRLAFHKEISLYGSSNNSAHISSIVESILGSLKSAAGVRLIRIAALQIARQISTQSDFERQGRDLDLKNAETELINNLCSKIGDENLTRLELRESYVPESSYRYSSLKAVSAQVAACGPTTRPSYLFKTPQSVLAISLLPDRPPTRIIWNGETLQIASASLPEKISLEWWDAVVMPQKERELEDRLYFRVQDNLGRWLWVFRDSAMQWFVHGVWS